MQTVNDNKEIICTLVTIIVGAVVRAIEKRKLRKSGKLNDK
jgi:hypothetical protein